MAEDLKCGTVQSLYEKNTFSCCSAGSRLGLSSWSSIRVRLRPAHTHTGSFGDHQRAGLRSRTGLRRACVCRPGPGLRATACRIFGASVRASGGICSDAIRLCWIR
jgi:hypothetical protein